MFKKTTFLSGVIFCGLALANFAKAVCPVCVVAVGAGVGLCRWLGVDDTISGLWIGGVTLALAMWTVFWLKSKKWSFKFDWALVTVAYFGLVLFPLFAYKIVGHPNNKVLGVDKLLFGIGAGGILFLLSSYINSYLKNKNGGKVYFPYQKVAIPVIVLIIASGIFYLIIKCY